MKSTRYKVIGMSCDKCVEKVKEKLEKLDDVGDIDATLNQGDEGEADVEVFAKGEQEAPRVKVAQAVREAGFKVVIE